MFGLAGFGFTLTGNFFKDDFDSNAGWQTQFGSPIFNNGILEMTSPQGTGNNARCALMKSYGSLPSQYTVEFKLKMVQFGGSDAAQQSLGFYSQSPSYWIPFGVYAARIGCGTQSYTVNVDNNWHVWTLVVDASTVGVYLDGAKLTNFQRVDVPDGGMNNKISLDGFGSTSKSTIAQLDYIYIDSGLVPPSGGATKGKIHVVGWLNGANVAMTNVYYVHNGVSGTSLPNVPIEGYTWTSLELGTYFVHGTYNGVEGQPAEVTVTAGETPAEAGVIFTGTVPPGKVTITVVCQGSSGTIAGLSVSCSGQASQNSPAAFVVEKGQYTIQVPSASGQLPFKSWDDGSTSTSRTVNAQAAVTITATYGSGGGGGGDQKDFLTMIREFLAQPNIKNLMLAAGGLTTLLCGVMFILPEKRYGSPAPPPPPYYRY
jgi:hypothetical protein